MSEHDLIFVLVFDRELQRASLARQTPQHVKLRKARQALACKKYRAKKKGLPWPPVQEMPTTRSLQIMITPCLPPPPAQTVEIQCTEKTVLEHLEHLDLHVSLGTKSMLVDMNMYLITYFEMFYNLNCDFLILLLYYLW